MGDVKEKLTAHGAGQDFRTALSRVGMTQTEFCRFTQTSYNTAQSWAKGRTAPSGAAMTVLAILDKSRHLADACRANGWEPLWRKNP